MCSTINISVFFNLMYNQKGYEWIFFKYVGEMVQLTNAGTVEREDSRDVAPPPPQDLVDLLAAIRMITGRSTVGACSWIRFGYRVVLENSIHASQGLTVGRLCG